MKNKKFWIIIGTLVIIFLGLLFWPTDKNSNVTKIINRNIVEPNPEFLMDSPKSIGWGEIGIKNYTTAEALLVDQKSVDVNQKIEIRNILNPEFGDKEEVFIFDDNKKSLEYSGNIQEKKQLEKGTLGTEEIKLKFGETTNKLKRITASLPIIERVDYKQFVKPRWISSDERSVDAVEILANYYHKDIPVKSFYGYMVEAVYFTNGKLVKWQQQLPFEKAVKTTIKKLWTLAELKNIDKGDFKIWRIDGGADYELSGDSPAVGDIKINDYDLEYIYDVKSGVVWPFYFLKGESNLSTGTAKVTLIISAVKE